MGAIGRSPSKMSITTPHSWHGSGGTKQPAENRTTGTYDPGGRGSSLAHTALKVEGKATFSRSGIATVPAGKRSIKKSGVPLSASSMVLATIQVDRVGIYVEAAVPNVAGSSFTIDLNKVVG